MSYNKAIIMGNLTRDPELRVTPKGTSVATFTVAVNRKFKTDGGVASEEVSFLDCEAWGKTAENVSKFFSKGRPILVEGRLKQDSWEDKQTGQKRSRVKVIVETFAFCGGGERGESRAESAPPQQPAPAPAAQGADEDVPF